jgi:hypothetical protein
MTVTGLTRRNWPDTYDKLIVEDPHTFDRAIMIAMDMLFLGKPVPPESVMPLTVRQFVANTATILTIAGARDYYVTRTVVSEALEGDQRVKYNWSNVLDTMEQSLKDQNEMMAPIVSGWIIEWIASLGGVADGAYPKTSSQSLCQIWVYPDPCKVYHVTPNTFVYSLGLFDDF